MSDDERGCVPADRGGVVSGDVEALAEVLAAHSIRGYGSCSCGVEYHHHGRYSADHRHHVAAVLAAHLQAARADELEQAADGVEELRFMGVGIDLAAWLRHRAAALRTPDAAPETAQDEGGDGHE